MATQTFFRDQEYALGVFANGMEVSNVELRTLFSRAALRQGLEVHSTGDGVGVTKTEPVITFNVPVNTSFSEMQSVIDIVRDVVKGAVVVSLSKDIYGKPFVGTADRIQRMRGEAMIKSVPSR